ncbi:hypothetical protein D3C76_1554330 [compost metagenome]
MNLYDQGEYEILFKNDLVKDEISDILDVEVGNIHYFSKNENGDIIKIDSCVGQKHYAYIGWR